MLPTDIAHYLFYSILLHLGVLLIYISLQAYNHPSRPLPKTHIFIVDMSVVFVVGIIILCNSRTD